MDFSHSQLVSNMSRALVELNQSIDAEKEAIQKLIDIQPYPELYTVYSMRDSNNKLMLENLLVARANLLAAMANLQAASINEKTARRR